MEGYPCPDCKKPIYDKDALLCHFCGGSLRRASKGGVGGIRYIKPRALWVVVVLTVLLGFVFWVVR